MRILHVSPCWYPSICGVVPLIHNISKNLINEGHEVGILIPSTPNIEKNGLQFYTVTKVFDILGMNPIVYGLMSKLKELQKDYDVILAHSYIFEMNSRIALYRKLGIIDIPVILYFHGGLDPAMAPHVGSKVRLFKKIYDPIFGKICIRYSDHIISVSKPDIPLIAEKFGISTDKISYIPNGVDVNRVHRKNHEKLRIIFIGRLVKWKGITFFEDIIMSLPQSAEFLIVGNGPMRNIVESLSLKYKNVRWVGNVSHDKVLELLAESDIFVLPSFTEASPFSCLEASATGIPSVVFCVGDIPNILPDNCGFKIKPYDIHNFCDKINYLIENEHVREQMGRNARNYVKNNLGYDNITNQILTTLNKIVYENINLHSGIST